MTVPDTSEVLGRVLGRVRTLDPVNTRAWFDDLEIIEKRFLGDKRKYEDARQGFIDWGPIRDEVIVLMHGGQHKEAAEVTKDKEARHVEKIELAMEALGVFAQGKASEFLGKAEKTRAESFRVINLFMYAAVAAGVLLAFLITRSITLPLMVLRAVTEKIGRGDLDT
ncbi:hypothetical protein LCGC14_2750930, partial [marine sediment metagenome]